MQKIKLFIESDKGKDILIVCIVILVGICSFYLGRLSNQSSNNGLKIDFKGQEATAIGATEPKIELNTSINERINNEARGSYFASKRGKKYYSTGCSAGKSIKNENRIYFNSTTEAEKAGYSFSTSC